MFFSHNTPTSPGRRVIITNVTRGLNRDPLPYTDREYERGQISEKTKVSFGSQHDRRKLVVLPGRNLFKYEIVQTEDDNDLETILAAGTFSAVAQKKSFYIRLYDENELCAFCFCKFCFLKICPIRILICSSYS